MPRDDALEVLPAAASDAVAFGVPLLEAIPQPQKATSSSCTGSVTLFHLHFGAADVVPYNFES